ncbi:MAG: hypothetical protein JO250_24390 [Armatimonadetes bacterium]|nr:hypothetical protein [Armatimonadota bacterium]
MDNPALMQPETRTDAEYEAAVDSLLADMRHMQEVGDPDAERRDGALLQQELAAMRQELRELTQTIQQIQAEMRHDRDMAARDRENLILRLENSQLRSERQLPPGKLQDELPPD